MSNWEKVTKPRTIARNWHKQIERIFLLPGQWLCYTLHHNFEAQDVTAETVRKQYEQFSFARLYEDSEGYTMRVHGNLWYQLKIDTKLVAPVVQDKNNPPSDEPMSLGSSIADGMFDRMKEHLGNVKARLTGYTDDEREEFIQSMCTAFQEDARWIISGFITEKLNEK